MRYFTWKLELVSNNLRLAVSEKLFSILTHPPHRSKLSSFDKFGNSMAFHTALTKKMAIRLEKMAEVCLTS